MAVVRFLVVCVRLTCPVRFPECPYLEDPAIWMDFHERFIIYCSDAINDRLPDRYDARVEERVSLIRTSDDEVGR